MKKVLVVAAHPDDEILGCGGTLLKHIQSGDKVSILVLGEGISSRYVNKFEAPRSEFATLGNTLDEVASIMGAEQCHHLAYPDNRFDSVDLLDIVKSISLVKNRVRPDIIYTHFSGDLNIDHKITFQAVLTACRPMIDETVKEIYSFYIASATDWGQYPGNVFSPTLFVNIEDDIDQKMELLKLYDEMREYPHPRSLRAIKNISEYYGSMIGCHNAEAFEVIRHIR